MLLQVRTIQEQIHCPIQSVSYLENSWSIYECDFTVFSNTVNHYRDGDDAIVPGANLRSTS